MSALPSIPPDSPDDPLARWSRLAGEEGVYLADCISECPELARMIHVRPRPKPGQPPIKVNAYLSKRSILFMGDGAPCATVDVRWRVNDEPFGSAEFSMYPDDGTCTWESIYIEEPWRRSGVGRAYLRALVRLCRSVGVHQISLHANNEGRYVWAREGFLFSDSDSRAAVVRGVWQFSEALGIELPFSFDPETVEPIDIARQGGEISQEEFARARNESIGEPEGPMTLGKALLLGAHGNEWVGKLEVSG